MQRPEPAYTEQSLARHARPTKGGAVRIRIALKTAVAVIAVPILLLTFFDSSPAASASRNSRPLVAQERTRDLGMNLMSYDQAHKVAKLMAFANAVETHAVKTYLGEVAYLQSVAANSVSAIPAAWLPTAMCEEGGRDDPISGYFGIREWHGFDGYPTAGSAPLSVQLAWEAAYIGGPPDAPGRCHSY
jgi:hypothetical protein